MAPTKMTVCDFLKKLFLLVIFLLADLLLFSHEFWLHPEKFMYQPGETINIKFMVGENFSGENWKGNRSRTQKLKLYLSDATDDLSSNLSEENGDSLQIALFEEGSVLITFQSNNSFIELEAEKFNEYLKEDGLESAITYRKTHNETDSIGRELYQRNAKTLVQVGSRSENFITQRTDLPVDIVPLVNPYTLKNGDSLTAKVYYQKSPLANSTVKVWHRNYDSTSKQELTTNEKGEIKFPVLTNGRWMISTVKILRIFYDPRAQWQSYWGSATWGYEK
jgi:uncharacterized GH25 family protein